MVLKTVVRRETDAKNEVETTNDNSAEKVVCQVDGNVVRMIGKIDI